MKLSRITSLALAASFALPAMAHAQQQFWFAGVQDASVNFKSFGVGPYKASTNAALPSPFSIFCIDFDDHANSTWKGRVMTFAMATANNANGTATAVNLYGAVTPLVTIQKLNQAAWLSDQFALNSNSQWANIHDAIWSLFSSNSLLIPTTANASASAFLTSSVLHQNDNFDNYNIIVDDNAWTNPSVALNQVFLIKDTDVNIKVVTPEPSTYALMGVGLLAVGFARRRRRSA